MTGTGAGAGGVCARLPPLLALVQLWEASGISPPVSVLSVGMPGKSAPTQNVNFQEIKKKKNTEKKISFHFHTFQTAFF